MAAQSRRNHSALRLSLSISVAGVDAMQGPVLGREVAGAVGAVQLFPCAV